MHAKLLQSFPTLCNPMNCGPTSSSVHGIPQAKILEWVAILFSNSLSCTVCLSAPSWVSRCLIIDEGLSVQFSSVAQSCLTLCNPMDCSTSGLLVHRKLLEFTQTHVH